MHGGNVLYTTGAYWPGFISMQQLAASISTPFEWDASRKLVILSVVIAAAVLILGLRTLCLLFPLLFSQRVSSQSCKTLRELQHDPCRGVTKLEGDPVCDSFESRPRTQPTGIRKARRASYARALKIFLYFVAVPRQNNNVKRPHSEGVGQREPRRLMFGTAFLE